MSQKPIRRTQARVAERERRRAKEERNRQLKWLLPLTALGVFMVLVGAYALFTAGPKPSGAASAGANGPHFQANAEKIDLGDQPLGKTVHASFNVENTGGGTLTLNAAQVATVLEGC